MMSCTFDGRLMTWMSPGDENEEVVHYFEPRILISGLGV